MGVDLLLASDIEISHAAGVSRALDLRMLTEVVGDLDLRTLT
jgi:hypothetical protein